MSAPYVEMNLNGQSTQLIADSSGNVLSALRHHLGLTATRFGCGQEQCGACHVLINGQSKPICQTPLEALQAAKVVTLESHVNDDLASTRYLKVLQSAFVTEQAAQCGYCTSGLLISATALLMNAQSFVSERQIREALEPHLCRCGAHNRILSAVKTAVRQCGLNLIDAEVSA